MARACRACGTENPDVARFCLACGAPLGGERPVRRERKFAAALFADLVGSTSLGEREDPEVVQSLVSGTFRRLTEEVERYGGIVDKVMGDAILAIFGVPATHEDDPERAVRAALEMQAVLAELNRAAEPDGRPALALRIGVEAGEVLVHLERAADLPDRMLTGDAVNTAARLQAAAQPGHVVVGPTVYASTRAVVDYRELAPLVLKGKAEAVPAWEAVAVKARRGGERAPLGLEARLVGRDEEMSFLKETFHRVRAESRPVLVTVIGPAGVGKSRLVWEFQKYVEGLPDGVTWRKGRCLAYGNQPYSALADAVKVECGILDDDPPGVVRGKVAAAVEALFGTRDEAPHVEALVGATSVQVADRDDLFDYWRRLLERMAAREPLVLVLEDIHWADEGLFDFVDHAADLAAGPLLVLTIARPELLDRRPTWGGGKRNYAAISLEALTEEENVAMLRDLLGDALPQEVLAAVIERAEGNPLFTEEMVRSFMDVGVLRPLSGSGWELAREPTEMELPRSIHGLIATRLDSLPGEEKALLQDAAVIGRFFWPGAVAHLAGRSAGEARTLLGRLRVKELIVPREPSSFAGEAEFGFRHVLIRDVAYESLPKGLRAAKHEEVARWAEERAGERAPEFAGLLATHQGEAVRYLQELGQGGPDLVRAQLATYRWARVAGERAESLWDAAEAVRWYREALDLAEPAGLTPVELARLWDALARSGESSLPIGEVIEALEQARVQYEELGMPAEVGSAESRLALAALSAGRFDLVMPHLERALEHLDPLGDSLDLARALSLRGQVLSIMERHEEAEATLRRAARMAEQMVDPGLRADLRGSLGGALSGQGRWREALPLLEEGYEYSVRTEHHELMFRMAPMLALALLRGEEPDDARSESILRIALDTARAKGVAARAAWAGNYLAMLLMLTGRVGEAIETSREALEAARLVGQSSWIAVSLNVVALMEAVGGNVERAGALIQESLGLVDVTWGELDPTGALVRILLAEARSDPAGAIDAYRMWGTKHSPYPEITDELKLHGVRALLRVGEVEEARAVGRALAEAAADQPVTRPFAAWATGLLCEDPAEARRHLQETAALFEGRGRPVALAECLLDLAEAERRAGADPGPTMARAAALAERSGAFLLVPGVREPAGE